MRLSVLILSLYLASVALGANETQQRLKDASEVFSEIMSTPDKGIPQELLDNSYCIVIVPGMKQGAFVFGAKYGKGFAVCRKPSGLGWGAPAAMRIEGGSFGFQIGGSSTDVIMLVMNERGMRDLVKAKFTLGGDAQVAAGPVGRNTSAQTGALLTAEILSWSRSKGLFAGVALTGATLRQDLDDNMEMYGKPLENQQILMKNITPPRAAEPLIRQLNKYSMREEGKPLRTNQSK